MLRVFRVLRILRLLKGAKGVRDLLMTLVLSFPALVNVFGLLALCMFIYSILGVQLFTFVMRGDNLTDDRNFDTFGQAALLLFQVITGDGWSGLMEDCMVDQARGCDPAEGNCGSWVALPFFLTYLLIATFVVINLVIAVVLENFTMLGSQDPNMITGNDIDVFKEVWAEFDPDANGMVPVVDLPALVARVPPPLGLGGVDQRKCARFCMNLEISPVNGEVKFKDMLDALVNKNFAEHGEELPTDAAAAAKVIEERKRSAAARRWQPAARRYRHGRKRWRSSSRSSCSQCSFGVSVRNRPTESSKSASRRRARAVRRSQTSLLSPALRARLPRWPPAPVATAAQTHPRPRRGARLRSLRAHPHWRRRRRQPGRRKRRRRASRRAPRPPPSRPAPGRQSPPRGRRRSGEATCAPYARASTLLPCR